MNLSKSNLILLLISVSVFIGCNSNETSSDYQQTSTDGAAESALNNDVTGQEIIPIPNTTNSTQHQPDRISRTQQELLSRNESPQVVSEAMRYKLDVAPYNRFADSEGYLNLIGVDITEIDNVLGSAPAVVKLSREGAPVRREVRVYMPYDKDPTGLYIYFLNEKVQHFRMDEFNGITNSSIMDFFNNN
jgi:hypothetical protein